MHVLGLPPAFVLSQDQTLKLKSSEELILDVEPSHICLNLSPGQSSVCAKSPKRPNQDSEADTYIIGACTPSRPICTRSAVETTKPPAYPFIIHQCQRAQRQKSTGRTNLTWRSRPIQSPEFPRCRLRPRPFRTVPRFRSTVRFGEAVFRESVRGPQAEKAWVPEDFLQPADYIQNSWSSGPWRQHRSDRIAAACSPDGPPCPAAVDSRDQARCVIRPPQTVRAMPMAPTWCGSVASISPPRSTRSPASPGTSRPVTPSRWAAQAPPAV